MRSRKHIPLFLGPYDERQLDPRWPHYDPKRDRRPRYQFSLRTLLAFVLVGGLACGVIGKKLRTRWRGQRLAAAFLEEQEKAAVPLKKLGARLGCEQSQLEDGVDVPVVRSVDFGRTTRCIDADLVHLKDLTSVESLGFSGTRITDAGLKHLKELPKLQYLTLRDTQVSDAGLEHLRGMTQLQVIDLSRHGVTQADLGRFRKDLATIEALRLPYPQDPEAHWEQLRRDLAKMEALFLRDTQVTEAGVKKLQQALPDCKIVY